MTNARPERSSRLLRIVGLIRKETLQIIRDPSSYLIAVVLPLLLLFIFGYGVSLDLRNVPVGLVVEQAVARGRQPGGVVSQLAVFYAPARAASARGRG